MKQKEFDIEKRVYQFSLSLLQFIPKLSKTTENLVLTRQIIRSGTSIGANIHEARGGHSIKDFANYYSISLKSANETVYWLRLIRDSNKDFTTQVNELIDEASAIKDYCKNIN